MPWISSKNTCKTQQQNWIKSRHCLTGEPSAIIVLYEWVPINWVVPSTNRLHQRRRALGGMPNDTT